MNIMKTIEKINGVISKVLTAIIIILFIWMIVAFSIQVFGRYIFSTGFPWTEELTRYGMIWMVFLGAAWIIFNGEHVKITILEDVLKGRTKKTIMIVQTIMGLLFVAAIFYFSIGQLSLAAKGRSANTGISNAMQYMVFPISMILSCWGYITKLIRQFREFNAPAAEAPTTAENEEGGGKS